MKKSTISKIKSLFGSKKGKKQNQHQQSAKSSRSPSPEPAGASPINGESFRPLMRTPPPSRAGPPPSPPVPTHPVAPVAPEPAGPLPLMPCLVCGRTFLPQSLAKHAKICEKMTVKKRKTFDSSRQRREGTDLEQYLPKNFGLPENSPFLEKSPPATAKPTPKPKVQSVRNAITKPMAELQKCPHCSRAFGVRAFERHVEWCADKAKILPAAPAQPPPHIADAKQRLNARTQYKAPLARGRRSSQTRDKSSNSRSASVESSRGVSPPPPREYGDYKHGRTRASESVSSNDCHEETSPHVPVIRNTRVTQNNMSGDANVKARQARLARDLNSTRNEQETQPQPSSVQPSSTDPNIKKSASQKPRNKLNVKKQQQLKKLEEIAQKYNEKIQKKKEDSPLKKLREKSQIPVPKKANVTKASEEITDDQLTNNVKLEKDVKETTSPNPNSCKRKPKSFKAPSELSLKDKKTIEPVDKNRKVKYKVKECIKIVKENSMSVDSLDECPLSTDTERNYQSIGINTELHCVPCVIHDVPDQKKCNKKTNTKDEMKSARGDNISEPKIELLYRNPIMVSSCDIQAKQMYEKETDSKDDLSNFNYNNCITPSNSDNLVSDNIESATNFHTEISDNKSDIRLQNDKPIDNDSIENKLDMEVQSHEDLKSEDMNELSAEILEDDYEHNVSDELFDDSIENKFEEIDIHEENDIECRHGSGETYTKFTEDPADLEEFIHLTDKMMNCQNVDEETFEMENDVDNFHTPKTNSIEAINKSSSDYDNSENPGPKHNFSDSLEELKSNLKDLLEGAGDKFAEVLNKTNEAHDVKTSRKVCNMEHVTVYGLKLYVEKPSKEANDLTLETKDDPNIFKLPSIAETNKPERKTACNKKRLQKIYKPNRRYKMLGEQTRANKDNQTFILNQNHEENSDDQSISADAPPFKLPRIENKRLDDNYDPFVSAARQMKELMSSDTNIPKKMQNSSKDLNRTLPTLRASKEKGLSTFRSDNIKMMKDTLNKTYQKTPTLQRMKSFGCPNNENNGNTFGGRCSSFRINRNDKKSSPKLNTTFTKSSKENISTVDKSYFSRNNSLNRSFSSYTASSYSTPKPKDKIPKIATSMYHSFQRTTIKQPVKLDKIKREDEQKNFVNLDVILADDNSSMTDSNYIDPRLINENDNLPINVNTILNNPDMISSMESLLTTENLPAKFESFSSSNLNNNNKFNGVTDTSLKNNKLETNNNVNKISAPTINDLSTQYDKIMSSLEQSIASKTSVRDDDSLCEDFDLEEFMTSFDEEIHKHKLENKRTCSSTTRVVKQSELVDSNRNSELNSNSSSPKVRNGMLPVNKSMSLNFSSNNIVNENLFPSSVKRSTSLLDSIQKKSVQKDNTKSRHKADQLEQDIMQSLKDFDKFYGSERNENGQQKETVKYNSQVHNGTAKRDTRTKYERKNKKNENISNGNYTPNGKSSNDSAYSSLNRISPSKLSICTPKEPNGLALLETAPAGSDSGGSSHKEDIRSISSEEFLAMERSAELDAPLTQSDLRSTYKEEIHTVSEKRVSSRASSRRSSTWRARGELSSSGSEASLHRGPAPALTPAAPLALAPRLSRFCHECGSKFPVDTAKFCIECGVKRLAV